MTSSLYAKKRREIALDLGIDTNDGLGGWSNHYITDGNHECHPDFKAHPFNNAHGLRVCVRKPRLPEAPMIPTTGGSHRRQLNLYGEDVEKPTQLNNAYSTQDRAMPHIHQHARDDLLRLPIQYDGIGMKTSKVNGYRYKHVPHTEYDHTKLHQMSPTVQLRR